MWLAKCIQMTLYYATSYHGSVVVSRPPAPWPCKKSQRQLLQSEKSKLHSGKSPSNHSCITKKKIIWALPSARLSVPSPQPNQPYWLRIFFNKNTLPQPKHNPRLPGFPLQSLTQKRKSVLAEKLANIGRSASVAKNASAHPETQSHLLPKGSNLSSLQPQPGHAVQKKLRITPTFCNDKIQSDQKSTEQIGCIRK